MRGQHGPARLAGPDPAPGRVAGDLGHPPVRQPQRGLRALDAPGQQVTLADVQLLADPQPEQGALAGVRVADVRPDDPQGDLAVQQGREHLRRRAVRGDQPGRDDGGGLVRVHPRGRGALVQVAGDGGQLRRVRRAGVQGLPDVGDHGEQLAEQGQAGRQVEGGRVRGSPLHVPTVTPWLPGVDHRRVTAATALRANLTAARAGGTPDYPERLPVARHTGNQAFRPNSAANLALEASCASVGGRTSRTRSWRNRHSPPH